MAGPLQPVVLIAFCSLEGVTEKLATAAAVGAVQGRAAIRLRRVPDSETTLPGAPAFTDDLARMRKEYVAPGESDLQSADAMVLGVGGHFPATERQWAPYLDMLRRLASGGKLADTLCVAFGEGPGLAEFERHVAALGLRPLETVARFAVEIPAGGVDQAVALGRAVAGSIRSARS